MTAALNSVEALRRALQLTTVPRVDVIVAAVLLDGSESSAPFVRAVADRVSYLVIPLDSKMLVEVPPEAFRGLKPHNRRSPLMRIFSARAGDMMDLYIIPPEVPGGPAMQLYHKGTEQPDPYLCNNQPLEPL